MKEKIFSGIQPTGKLHLGNYLGAIRQWVKLQNKYDSIFCIVDLHAITVDYDPENMQNQIMETALDFLACGIDPTKSKVFVQSDIPEHTELTWLFNSITSIGELERMTQFKEKSDKFKTNVNAGLFDYPVLQAADILIYKATRVPVGEDQIQHVELARDIARRFNHKFGQTFPEPKAIVTEGARILGLDAKGKMSKTESADSCLYLSDPPDEIRRKISRAQTDIGKEKDISSGTKNLFYLYKIFAGDKEFQNVLDARTKGMLKYSIFKPRLAEAIIEHLNPIQEKRMKMSQNTDEVKKILDDGVKALKPVAQKTIKEVKEKMGI